MIWALQQNTDRTFKMVNIEIVMMINKHLNGEGITFLIFIFGRFDQFKTNLLQGN